MNSKELVNNLLNGKSIDRIGYYDHGPWTDTLSNWAIEGYQNSNRGISQRESLNLFFDDYKYDMRSVGGFDSLPIKKFHEIVRETDEWVEYKNGAGTILRNFKFSSSAPEYVNFTMSNREIWEREYKPYLLEADMDRADIAGMKNRMEKCKNNNIWSFFGKPFIYENMRASMGNVCMMESMILDPDWIHDFNRIYTDFYKNMFRKIIDEVGKPDGIWIYEDLGYKNGLMCSPKLLSEMIFPYYKELVDFFHLYDLPVILHTDGRIDEALPLIIEAGFSAINPMEVKAGCDTFKYAEKYGDKLAFIGGFDGRILETNDKDLIKREVISVLRRMKSSGAWFIFGVDHSISNMVSYSTFNYFIEVYREHMMY